MSELKSVFDSMVATSINRKNMKILNALNEVKKALNSRDYTTTDRSYLKAVLFPEKSKGAKIPSIYPTSTNSFKQSTRFEIVVNSSGFFAIALDVENSSNLAPTFYEFNQGTLEDWKVPRHLRFDGTQMSNARSGVADDTQSRVSDRKDASLVFDTSRIVGASLSCSIQKKPDEVYGLLEGALDSSARIDASEFMDGADPDNVLTALLYQYDSMSIVYAMEGNEAIIRVAALDRELMTDGQLARSLMWSTIVKIFSVGYASTSGPVSMQRVKLGTYLSALFDSRQLSPATFPDIQNIINERRFKISAIRTAYTPTDPNELIALKKIATAMSENIWVLLSAELKLLDLLDTVILLAFKKYGTTVRYDDLLSFVKNLLDVVVQGVASRQRDFVKQRINELVNVRTVPVESSIFQSDRIRGLSFYSEAPAAKGLRVLYIPTRPAELLPIHELKTGPRPFLMIFGHSLEVGGRVIIECSRVFETQTNIRYRDYIVPTKAVPDPRSLSIINYIHTTASWMLHIAPGILDGVYEEVRASLGHFDVALEQMNAGGKGVTVKDIQERIQQTENIERLE